MKLSRLVPYRKVRVVLVIGICAYFTYTVWNSAGRSYLWSPVTEENSVLTGKLTSENAQGGWMFQNFLRNAERKNWKQDLLCEKVIPFRDISGGRISTYDLPNETDFSLGNDGRYKLPVDIANAKDDDEPLKVILVPFSHSDPGYGRTVEQYYSEMTRSVLDNMVNFLTEHRNMTFQFVETIFLERWFRDIGEETKRKVRVLIERGQLEIVLGGWVMPDEAITHYVPVVDQLIEGHQWLLENLGVRPKNAWINDPFGYSSTMPYLWKTSGIENMVFLRIHQAIKHTLMRKRSLDFIWRPYWNVGKENDILCNLMPYSEYWNSNVCGPDQRICEKFNFLWLGTPRGHSEPVTESNIESLAAMLHKEYKFTASFFQYKTLVIFIGEDNSFTEGIMWENTFVNYEKLMKYINSKPEWKMHLKFGTVREYFDLITKEEAKYKTSAKFPILSGDFFPYSDKQDDYWTGYFTTRPWMKRFTREVEAILRAADRFSVLLYHHCVVSGLCEDISKQFTDILRDLQAARREVGIYQHHDGITGTSLPFVVDDYEHRLNQAFSSARKALTLTISLLLSNGKFKEGNTLSDNIDRTQVRAVTTPKLLRFKNDLLKLVVVNPLERSVTAAISFYTDKQDFLVTGVKSYQISKADLSKFRGNYLVTMTTDLSPFELKTLLLTANKVENPNVVAETKQNSGDTREILTMENSFMKVEFFGINGSLRSITDKNGQRTEITNEFLKYVPHKSGAYLFGPKGPAKRPTELPRPDVTLSNGPLFSQITVAYKSLFVQKWTLYKTSDTKSLGLYLTQEVNLAVEPNMVESEVIIRFKTDIDNKNIFYTDQNGFQMIGRRNNITRPIETNYYPMTTMAIVEDEKKRLTLHSAQSHGVASLKSGWLEVMLDRNMQHDDGKGLGQGAYERVITQTEFVLQVEHKETPQALEEVRYTHASVSSILLNEQLQNQPRLFSVEVHTDYDWNSFNSDQSIAQKSLPCDLSIVGLRILVSNDLKYKGTSLVLHRRPKHCSFPISEETSMCSLASVPVLLSDLTLALGTDKLARNVTETSLSHLYMKSVTTLMDDIRPNVNELRAFLLKTVPYK